MIKYGLSYILGYFEGHWAMFYNNDPTIANYNASAVKIKHLQRHE
jgi:hypothetical protein